MLFAQFTTEQRTESRACKTEANVAACPPLKNEQIRQQRTDMRRIDFIPAGKVALASDCIPILEQFHCRSAVHQGGSLPCYVPAVPE
ncbi:hypothetical protein SFHH103_01136 [Sinorhizobium fredii HH103]|uniref:Uncharacterized protein n=1 Tax=Sinorhizobium fredii (strain HH103) TaxID=1117943 RepID=G9A4Z0_SINF1|nr:hypothetical protein SFHH103_01136 [Sinorhizobium fredii HH103]